MFLFNKNMIGFFFFFFQNGNTALHEAAWNGYSKCVEFLVNAKCNVNIHNRVSKRMKQWLELGQINLNSPLAALFCDSFFLDTFANAFFPPCHLFQFH